MTKIKKTQPDIRAEILEKIKKIKNSKQEEIIKATDIFCKWWNDYNNTINNTIEPIARCK